MEEIKKLIINDTHFGVKNNSINFLNSQMLLFDALYEYIETCEENRIDLIHLGDIFESRSSVSIYILSQVRDLLQRLDSILKKRNPENRFIFVAGNHDFYSPTSDTVNTLDTVIKDFLPDAVIVSRECWIDGDDIYIPWYWMNDPEKFASLDLNPYHRIFTHCDCRDFQFNKIPVNTAVYSGHIHQYKEYANALSSNHGSRLYNLSAQYSLDYGDSNDDKKGFWELDGYDLKLHQNNSSIKFRTFYNEQIFDIPDLDESISRRDNFRIYLTSENRSKLEYINKVNEICAGIKYIDVLIIDENYINESSSVCINNLSISDMISDMIPEHLKENFNIIVKSINES